MCDSLIMLHWEIMLFSMIKCANANKHKIICAAFISKTNKDENKHAISNVIYPDFQKISTSSQ